MKSVVFGPERRLRALAADCVIDLNRGFARYLQSRQSGSNAETAKAATVRAQSEIAFYEKERGSDPGELIETIHGADGCGLDANGYYAVAAFGAERYVGKLPRAAALLIP
jgi:hypothetical protein